MIHAQADTMETFKLSIWYETLKTLLINAADQRDASLLRRAQIHMDGPRFADLPLETKHEIDILHSLAVVRTGRVQLQ